MIPIYRPNIGWLREAISGPLGAGLGPRDMQIALVDDASEQMDRDDVAAFWRECDERGIEMHRFENRVGLAGNWNRCLQLSRGHLVHILHQDDRVVPEFYRATAAGLETAPGAGAIFAQHTFVAGDGAVILTGRLDRAEPGLLDNWLEDVVANLAVQCSAIVVRRAVYEQLGGFDASYDYYPDREMWLRIAVEYPLWLEPQPLAECRVHEHSGSWAGGHRIASWLELRRSVDAAIERISPPARRQVGRSARRHLVRLLIPELRRVVQKRDFRGCVVALAGAAMIGRVSDFVAVLRGRFDVAPASRPPPRPEGIKACRLPRILLLTEFYPEAAGLR
jgi:hypothetical protein